MKTTVLTLIYSATIFISLSNSLPSSLESLSLDRLSRNLFLVSEHNYNTEARLHFLIFRTAAGKKITLRTPVGNKRFLARLRKDRSQPVSIRYTHNSYYQPIQGELRAFQKHMPCSTKNGQSVTCLDQMVLAVD